MLDSVPLVGEPAERLPRRSSGTASRPCFTAACSSRSWASATSARSTATTCRRCASGCEMVKDQRRARSCCTCSPRRGTAFRRRARTRSRTTRRRCSRRSARTADRRRSRSGGAQGVHRRRQRRRSTRRCSDDPRVAVHHRGDVPGQQAGEGPRRLPRPLLRRRHLRVARRRLRRRPGQGRPAADRRHLLHVPAAVASTRSSRKSPCRTCRSSFTLDRAGLTGPDGPTHHGVFDIAYMRLFPNMVVMAPGDEADVPPMLDFALEHDGPGVDALSEGERRERSSAHAAPDRAGPGRGLRDGARRRDPRLRHAAGRAA